MKIKLSQICAPHELQSRAGMDEVVVAEYAEAMAAGAIFPAIIVFQDPDDESIFWLAGGFHRRAAAEKAGLDEIEAEVRQGDKRAALLFSLGENATHGLRRTNADKRKAVETLLRDPEWAKWSDREIARQVHVDGKTVAVIRRELTPTADFRSCGGPTAEIRKGADGKTRRLPARPSAPPDPVKDPHSAFHKLFEEFIATVPKEKRHYVCGQLRTVAWEFDPEAQAEQAAMLADEGKKRRKH